MASLSLAQQYEAAQREEREKMKDQLVRDEKTAREEYDKIAPLYAQIYQSHAIDIAPFISFPDLQLPHEIDDYMLVPQFHSMMILEARGMIVLRFRFKGHDTT
jgi:hypothetical protein